MGFTLLRVNPGKAEPTGFITAAKKRGVPLRVLDVTAPWARDLYERNLILIRPDQHSAWRGDDSPVDPAQVLARVIGR